MDDDPLEHLAVDPVADKEEQVVVAVMAVVVMVVVVVVSSVTCSIRFSLSELTNQDEKELTTRFPISGAELALSRGMALELLGSDGMKEVAAAVA